MLTSLLLFLTFLAFNRPAVAVSLQMNQIQQQEQQELRGAKLIYLKSKAASAAAEKNEQIRARQEEMLSNGKAYARRTGQALSTHLNRWRNRIEAMIGLSEETRAEALAEIDQMIAWIEQKAKQYDQVESIDQVKAINQEIRDYWQENKIITNQIVGLSLVEKAQKMIDWSASIYQKLVAAVATSAAAGDEIYMADTNLDNMQAAIDEAQSLVDSAKDLFLNLDSVDDFVDGKQLLIKAHQSLVEFRLEAIKLWQNIKS